MDRYVIMMIRVVQQMHRLDDKMPHPRLPPLLMLRAFEATARTGSMRKAADDLALSHTVISRHVRNLEGWMGRKLVLTGPKGVVLTDEGRILMTSVSKAFGLIAAATDQIRPARGAAILRIWCIPGLAACWLMPRLAALEQVLPGTEIVLRSTDAIPDFTRDEADIAVAFGDLAGTLEGATPLLLPHMFPIASRSWLAQNPEPTSLAELADCPLIHEESHRQWTQWFEAAGLPLYRPLHGPRLWDASLGINAARAGKGIVLGSRVLAREELDRGELVALLDIAVPVGGYYILPAPQLRQAPITQRLTGWLQAQLQATEADRQTQ